MRVTIHTERQFPEDLLAEYANQLLKIGVPAAVVKDFIVLGEGTWHTEDPGGPVTTRYTRD